MHRPKTYDLQDEALHCMKEIIRRSIMTLAALRDPDSRYLGWSQLPQHVVRDVQDAYGYSSASVRSFRPSPYEIEQMEVVLPWLAWLRRDEGDIACRRILGWAMGSALWRLGQREKCSDRTITNRIDRSITRIVHKFVGVDIEIEPINEPYKGAAYAMLFEKPQGPHGEAIIKKVYVGGVGYVKGGKIWRTGHERFAATA